MRYPEAFLSAVALGIAIADQQFRERVLAEVDELAWDRVAVTLAGLLSDPKAMAQEFIALGVVAKPGQSLRAAVLEEMIRRGLVGRRDALLNRAVMMRSMMVPDEAGEAKRWGVALAAMLDGPAPIAGQTPEAKKEKETA